MKRISVAVGMADSNDTSASWVESAMTTASPDLFFDNASWAWDELSLNLSDNNGTQDQPDPCQFTDFFFVVYGPLYGLVCGFGIVGNSLSFAVLHKYSRSNVATYLLKALAVMDNLFLATAACIQMYQGMVMFFGLVEQLEPIYPYFQTYVWPLAHMAQIGTVWMMVLVAANRYIAVCKPLQASRLCSKRNVQIQIVVLAAAIVVYNIPRCFEYRVIHFNVTDSANVTREMQRNAGLTSLPLYNILYENLAYCLFVFLIPLLVLLVFNVHLVHDLKKAQRCRRALRGKRGSVEENNITLVMIVIIIVFIICQTPAAINQILWFVVDKQAQKRCGAYMRYYHLCNLIILTNSSVNFIIYCLFRRQFQQELVALLCRRGRRGRGRTSSPRPGRPPHHQPLRKTVLLRALHEDSTTSLRDTTYSMYLRETSQESVPLRDNCCENPNFHSHADDDDPDPVGNHGNPVGNGKNVNHV